MYCHNMISLAEWRFWAFEILRIVYGGIKEHQTVTQSNATTCKNISKKKSE